MNFYDLYFFKYVQSILVLPLFRVFSTPFLRLIALAGLVFLLVKAYKLCVRRDAKRNFILLQPDSLKKRKLTVPDVMVLLISFILLIGFSALALGFVNLMIRGLYGMGISTDWYTRSAGSGAGAFQDISLETVIQGILIFVLYVFKTMYLMPVLCKTWINRNSAVAFLKTAWVSKLSAVLLICMALLQIANDYDIYLRLSFFMVWLWVCALISFTVSWVFIGKEVDRSREKKPLLTGIGFIREVINSK